MYHHYDISKNKKMIFKGLGNRIASFIWQQLDEFGSEVKQIWKTTLFNELHTYWIGQIYNTCNVIMCNMQNTQEEKKMKMYILRVFCYKM